jgi:YegS/Rv2252/BmrU family lipid kinase
MACGAEAQGYKAVALRAGVTVSDAETIGAIVNPRAAGGKVLRRWSEIAAVMTARLGPVAARFTSAPGEGATLAREFLNQGCKCLVAVGGDGTINEVVNGMLDHSGRVPLGVRLGILTVGTGGDFQRTLGIPAKLEEAVEVLAGGVPVNLDVGSAKFTGHDGTAQQRYFVNVASFGMGGEVAERSRRPRRLLGGRAAFLWATFRAFLAYRGRHVSLELDGKPAEPELFVTNVAVGNGRYHGGGMHPCPTAVPNDGILEVTVIEYMKMFELARDLRLLYSGHIYVHPKVRHLRCQRLTARAKQATQIEIDGEPLGRLPLEITLLAERLPVIVPRSSLLAPRP